MLTPTVSAADSSIAEQQEKRFGEALQELIYRWIQTEIPSWQPDCSPRYQRSSQALITSIPENKKQAPGLVYFKNIADPLWSDEDLGRLRAAGYPWILMILHPLEHFYQLETRLVEIIGALPRSTIWRPDTPSETEIVSLRRLIFSGTSTELFETQSEIETTSQEIHRIFTSLYVFRGQLINGSERQAIGAHIKNQKVSQYISGWLNTLSPKGSITPSGGDSFFAKAADENQVLTWAALMAGHAELQTGSSDHVKHELIAWWIRSAERLSNKMPDFPDVFLTTRMWREIKFVEGHLLGLKPVFQNLRAGTFSLSDAVNHVRRNFAWEQSRLIKWKQALDNMGGLALWLPAFTHAQEYLCTAFPLGQKCIDQLREVLIQSINEPHRFLEANARSEFDEGFLQFKKNYMDCYYSLHEEALHVMLDLKNEEAGVDSVALRNLDLLSRLQYTDKSYLNRVNVLGRWIQRNQCNLPVRQILERYPRCFCNFNPCAQQQPAGMASQINSILQEGIEYFRTALRRCQNLILEELKAEQGDDNILGQISALLGYGVITPLKSETIETLNRIIRKHPGYFHTRIRK